MFRRQKTELFGEYISTSSRPDCAGVSFSVKLQAGGFQLY